LISGNPNKIFETYQVGSDQMAFKFQRPDGSTHMAFANQDPRARAAGYAVPDATSQQNLLATANGIHAEYLNQASKEAVEVGELKGRVDNYGEVSGGSYWGRMGEYWNRMGTASKGASALERRDTLQNQTATYAQNYVDNMRGKISPGTAGYADLMDRSSQMNMYRSLQQNQGLGTEQAKETFNSTWRNSAWGAAKDTYTTASNAVASTEAYKAVSSAATSAWNTMGSYASAAWSGVKSGANSTTSTNASNAGSSGSTTTSP